MKLSDAVKLMRPKHYIKNFLLFVSIVFDKALFQPEVLVKVLGGFAAFSLLSSVVYIINDINDAEEDRRHPIKKNRPIASGAVRSGQAIALAVVLAVCSLALYAGVCGFRWSSFLFLLLYFLVNLGYSLGLKNVPFLDVVLLVSGFLLRVLFGAAIIDSTVSAWVSLTVVALSFYLGLGKRRNELKKSGASGKTRKVLSAYTYEFLDKFMYLCLTLAVAFYALWSRDAEIVAKYGTENLVWTVPMLIVLLMKYSADIEDDSYGDPVDVILRDKVLLLLCLVFVLTVLGMVYLPAFFH